MSNRKLTTVGIDKKLVNNIIIIIIGIQPLGRSGQRPEFSQTTGMVSGMLHPGQVLRGSLPLLSPAFF